MAPGATIDGDNPDKLRLYTGPGYMILSDVGAFSLMRVMNHIDVKFPLKPQKIFRMLLGVHSKFYNISLEDMLDTGEHKTSPSQPAPAQPR